ncbi:MAG: DPP IV N-terminal domain-containing protein, partial [Muribaculaceae bacterium]|nr:DPP IV N-terminal domain-containing protein [Muribaculaceae bacterium]
MNRFITSIVVVAAICAGEAYAATVDVNALAEYVYPKNATASASLNFMPDGLTYLQMSDDGKTIDRYDVATGKKTETVLDVARTRGDVKLDRIAAYTVSPDGSLLLVYQEKEQIYRRTFRAAYHIFDIKRNTLA